MKDFLVCRAGNGGSGEIVCEGKGKMVKNLKYQKGRQLKKNIWLNASGCLLPGWMTILIYQGIFLCNMSS